MPKQYNQQLTEDQKKILFEKQTEAPFTGLFLHNDEDGVYTCVNCKSVLFGAETKFDSGSGWPSFYDIRNKNTVTLIEDTSHGMHRVEVRCRTCDGHLGHVFDDAGDQPTGKRFCINSLALDFTPEETQQD